MRTALTFATLFLAGAAMAGAQAPAVPSTPAPADGSTVTVTGCLTKGDAAGAFVLNKVQWDPTPSAAGSQAAHHQHGASAPAAGAVAGSTNEGGTQAAAQPSTLRLAGNTAQLKLEGHVGHTVTATGMLAPLDPVVSPGVVLPEAQAKPGTGAGAKTGAAKPEAAVRVLNVRSVTHVAAECK